MRLAALLGLLWFPLVVSSLTAQETTGALQGRVLLADSTPASGAQLTLTGTHMQGPRTRVAGPDGFFQFLALPPGDYVLQVTRIGARPLVVDSILVSLGRTTGLGALALEAIPVAMEGVRISASRLSVDPVRTTAGGVLYAEDYANLPTERDFKAIIPVLPQVNISYRGGPPTVAGSSGLESQYFIDGVNTTDARNGSRATRLPYNFVRSVDVKIAGYEAQYGRALGAIVNAVTYSGTNEFESDAFAYVQPSALSGEARLGPAVAAGTADSYDMGVRVSGPLVRDRLWYSTALNPRREVVEQNVTGIGRFDDRTTAMLFANKLTWRARASTNVELSVIGDPTSRDRAGLGVPGITTVLNKDVLLSTEKTGGIGASLRAITMPAASLLIEGSLARQWDRYSVEGTTARARDEERLLDFVAHTASGGYGSRLKQDVGRTSLALRATWMLERHTLAAGIELDDQSVRGGGFTTGQGWLARLDTASWLAEFTGGQGTTRNRSPAAYVQDSWRPTGRLTVNAGLRWSGQYFIGASGNVVQRITDEWQPRMGFSLQLDDAGRARVFGAYGRFHQLLSANLATLWFQDTPFTDTWYTVDPRTPGATPFGVDDYSSSESTFVKRIQGLEAERFDEVSAGFERQLGSSGRASLRAVHRKLGSAFIYVLDSTFAVVLGTPGRGSLSSLPPATRDYSALEISAEGSSRRLSYRASYVLSRTWGNYSGLYDDDVAGIGAGTAWTMQVSRQQSARTTGYLPSDRRHVGKLSGAWSSPSGMTAGGFLTMESGSPYNAFASAFGPVFLVPRGTAGRTPALWNLDLRISWERRLPGSRSARLIADVLHVGNPRRVTRVDEVRYSTLDDAGNPANENANYGRPMYYQPPMAARLGLEVRW